MRLYDRIHNRAVQCTIHLPLAMFTEQLFNTLSADKSILIQTPEDILRHSEIG